MGEETEQATDLLPKEIREKLEAAHGEIVAVETRAGVAAFRIFKRAEFQRYQQMLFDDKQKSAATDQLVLTCCVHPDRNTFLGWLDKYPAIASSCASAVLDLGGYKAEAESKKYGTA